MLGLVATPISAETVAPGVEYTLYTVSGPNRVHVLSVDRNEPTYTFEVGWPQHKRNFTSRQTVPTITSQYDQPPEEDVLAAVNGSFFAATPVIIGTAASFGQILQMPDAQYDTYFFNASRAGEIVAPIQHQQGTLTFQDGFVVTLGYFNRSNPPIHAITAYTPEWDDRTGSAFTVPTLAAEVILEEVSYPMRGDKEVSGIVTAIQTGASAEDNLIPDGGMVLTAYGSAKDDVLAHTSVGDRLRMHFPTSNTFYNNARMAVTGIGRILNNGQADTVNWSIRGAAGPYNRHPRTVVAWSATHHYLVVIDGRSSQSVGMTFSEMASFLTGTLNATDAVNLDGGGSSTMVVDGTVRNSPSDGSPRAVANAVMLMARPSEDSFPFDDPFDAGGRGDGWDDKFRYHDVEPFSPTAPGGDGHVLIVADHVGGVDTTRRGNLADADYSLEAWIYAELRPDVAADGFERYGIFGRDSGTGAFGLVSYGGGNCYALTVDSDDGAVHAGKYVDGIWTDLVATSTSITESSWIRMRIDFAGQTIRYWVDGEMLGEATDTSHAAGLHGIGYHEFFGNNANINGTRVDRLYAWSDVPPPWFLVDWDEDGDCDLDDYAMFQACMTGQSTPQSDPACVNARLDADSDVDEVDLQLFVACLTGAGVPINPTCIDVP